MPKKLLDQLLVIDIEATCWREALPAGQENEIIEIGLEAALHTMRLPLEGTHHRGDDDAWNSAAILAELLRHSREGRGEPLG